MSRTVAIIQARMASTRLPGKVLYELAGRPMIALQIERARRTPGLDEVVLATSDRPENDGLAQIAAALGIAVYRGSEDDVLARYAAAAAEHRADIVVRLTGDCPLSDPDVIGMVLACRADRDLDYCTNVHPPTWPDGLDASAFTRAALERASAAARLPSHREHVVPWMWKNSPLEGGSELRAANVACPEPSSDQRWTVDDPADYLMMRALAEALGPRGMLEAGWRQILALLRSRPEIAGINAKGVRDAGLARSRASDAAILRS